MVKVFKDIVTGDEMVSDGYPHEMICNGAGLQVQGRLMIKGVEDGGVAQNLGEDEEKKEDAPGAIPQGDTVIDIVDRFDLKETKHDKKSFTAYMKVYLNRIKKHLEDTNKKERIKDFQKGAVELMKIIMGKIDEIQFFTGSSMEGDGALAFSFYPEGKTDPTFYFFFDGLVGTEY